MDLTLSLGSHTGELAALAAAGCWTASALAFTAAANRLGSLVLNIIRLGMAVGLFVLFSWIFRGLPLPTDASAHNWFWLTLSGLVGFTFGDLCLFRAYVLIGPRRSMLMLAVVPMMAALAGWIALDERLSAMSLAGMILTISGVAWVVLERHGTGFSGAQPVSATGVILGLGAAAGQAAGLILSKIGMVGYGRLSAEEVQAGVHPDLGLAFAATEIRAMAGLAGFVALFFVLRAWPKFAATVRNRSGLAYAAVGAWFGPFIGVWLSLVAVANTEVGVASTIMAIVPVTIIPFVILIYHERVSIRAVLGAVMAVVGVALLFL
jgi:drug/metabolite transporter (DMT)-like permease